MKVPRILGFGAGGMILGFGVGFALEQASQSRRGSAESIEWLPETLRGTTDCAHLLRKLAPFRNFEVPLFNTMLDAFGECYADYQQITVPDAILRAGITSRMLRRRSFATHQMQLYVKKVQESSTVGAYVEELFRTLADLEKYLEMWTQHAQEIERAFLDRKATTVYGTAEQPVAARVTEIVK